MIERDCDAAERIEQAVNQAHAFAEGRIYEQAMSLLDDVFPS